MEENKKKFEQEAKEFFADKSKDNVNTLYVTSDGCLFCAEHYANNWSVSLKDKNIEIYHRHGNLSILDMLKAAKAKITAGENLEDLVNVDTDEPTERDELVKQYIELFDKKPHYSKSNEKISAEIEAKKLELGESGDGDSIEGDSDQDDTKNLSDENTEVITSGSEDSNSGN
ncbi:hypothetical protein [Sphingobacterium siyangense]|uniref:hypothetical protein n=1 Tax=Sphingobacterium siyangense TaxID=459529 RepID=UPI00301B053E